ncbi:MAG: hypothetical protein JSW39_13540, partial [Desulfobacterales bacterium]
MELDGGKCQLTVWVLAAFLFVGYGVAHAQDISVSAVTAAPTSGQAGDTVDLQAIVRNNGPGMALAVQLRW